MTLGQWQTSSGFDSNSVAHWYSQAQGSAPLSEIFINDTAKPMDFDLGPTVYRDLERQPVGTGIQVPAFGSRILIADPGGIFTDGFESGDTSAWSDQQ